MGNRKKDKSRARKQRKYAIEERPSTPPVLPDNNRVEDMIDCINKLADSRSRENRTREDPKVMFERFKYLVEDCHDIEWPNDVNDMQRALHMGYYGAYLFDGYIDEPADPLPGIQNKTLGVVWLEKAALLGSPHAVDRMLDLAERHLNFHVDIPGLDFDRVERYPKYIKQMAEAGHIQSMLPLSSMYLSGIHVPRDLRLSDDWLLKAANHGDSRAINLYRVVVEWYNGAPMMYESGYALLRSVLHDGAVHIVVKHAVVTMENEKIKSGNLLKLCIEFSKLHPDVWWENASKVVYDRICYVYGNFLLRHGRGDIESELGIGLMTEAAGVGSHLAASTLSQLFDESGYRPDKEKCRYWREKTIEIAGTDAALDMARAYPEDKIKSRRKWIKSAAKLGNEEARAMLHRCHGPGCDKIDTTGREFKSCKCKVAIYCSTECYKTHWKSGHKEHCIGRVVQESS